LEKKCSVWYEMLDWVCDQQFFPDPCDLFFIEKIAGLAIESTDPVYTKRRFHMKKKWKLMGTGIFMVLTMMAGSAFCNDVYVYPAKGQDQQQIDKDKSDCYLWAKQQTGFDPAVQAPPQQAQAQAGGGVQGAARGALLGVAVGAIAGDAGKGAAIGAASGGLIGGMRQHDRNAQQQAAQQNQAAYYDQQRNNFNRAYQGCLEGRGYSVK
jgi:hypothetical protein